MVHVTVGQSWETDSYRAGCEAAQRATATLPVAIRIGTRRPSLILIFGDAGYKQQALLEGVTAAVGWQTPIVGCSASVQITAAGLASHSVAVMAIWGNSYLSILPVMATDVSKEPEEAGRRLAHKALEMLPHSTAVTAGVVRVGNRFVTVRPYSLLLFSGGFGGDHSPLIAGATSVLGPAFQVVGSMVGGSLPLEQGYQYFNGRTYVDAVVGMVLVSRTPTAVGVCHGCEPCSPSMLVSRSQGTVVHELDGLPALQAHAARFGQCDRGGRTHQTGMNGASRNSQSLHPVGIPELDGQYRVRYPVGVHTDGSIAFAAPVPEGMAVRWMACTPDAAIAAARSAAQQAVDGLGTARPAAAFVFSSAVRLRRAMEPLLSMQKSRPFATCSAWMFH